MNNEETGWTLLAGELLRSISALGTEVFVPQFPPPHPWEGEAQR
ncbi:hypothetical protein [Actinocrispum sp. NPDC049592]